METKINHMEIAERSIYLKMIDVADLPEDVQTEVAEHDAVFAVHNADGEQVALVASRDVASHLAQANDMTLVALH